MTDAARLAHHADAAGDGGAVLRFAPEGGPRFDSRRPPRGRWTVRPGASPCAADRRSTRGPTSSRATHTSATSQTKATKPSVHYRTRSPATGRWRTHSPRGGDSELSRQHSLVSREGGSEGREVGVQARRKCSEQLQARAPSSSVPAARSRSSMSGTLTSKPRTTGTIELPPWPGELNLDQNWATDPGAGFREVRAGSTTGSRRSRARHWRCSETGGREPEGYRTCSMRRSASCSRSPTAAHSTLAARWIDEAVDRARTNGLELSHLYGLAHRARLELDRGEWT